LASVAYSPDGRHIISGSHDHTIRIWGANPGIAAEKPLKGHTHSVQSIAGSSDRQHIVSGSCNDTTRVWDAFPSASTQPLLSSAIVLVWVPALFGFVYLVG